ncbi:MAG: adenylate/guanylate cyclase domain-containing protein [Roseiarcus sp.]|jgi:TolB-like protein/class 3 adenylate cyclase/Tfp pilus assembly protein PilF
MTETRKLAAILVSDVVGYSRLAGADEDRTLARLRALRSDLIDPTIAVHHGRVVKRTGDGSIVEFRSVVDAVRCAIEVQNGMVERNAGVPPERRIEFRVGIHLGDVVEESDGDLMGDGVNIAARLEGVAKPGAICLSEDAYRQVKARLDLAVTDLGPTQLKNIADPMRVYSLQVGVPAQARPATPAEPAAPEKPSAGLALPDKPSIAVLPFQNMSGDPEQEYFADGMVEDIITGLSRIKWLFVIARNSSFVYKGKAVDVRRVGRELGVRYVLEGGVRKAGNRVRITAQLIEAETGAHLWADKYDGALEDVFDLQDQITENVVGALQPTLTKAEIERARRKPPANLDAYDYMLRATPHVIANTPAEIAEAIRLLNEALRLDPNYAVAHALLANAYGQIFRAATGPQREEAQTLGMTHARRAISLGDDDSGALAHGGFMLLIMGQDTYAARAALDKAVTLNPNSSIALTYRSLVLTTAGEPEAAVEDATKALRLSPRDSASYLAELAIAIARIALGQYEDAVTWARRAIETNPRFPMSYAWLIVAECGRGNRHEAETRLRQIADIIPDFGPEKLLNVFQMFPPAIKNKSLDLIRSAGLIRG